MSISLNLDVDADEIVSSASTRDKKQLLKLLLEYMKKETIIEVMGDLKKDEADAIMTYFSMPGHKMTFMEDHFHRGLLKMSRCYMSITPADQAVIEEIAKKY